MASAAMAATTPWWRSLASRGAGPEQDGEQRHARGDPERGGGAVGLAGDHLVTARHRLQLQRDIGRGGDHRDHRHQHGEAGTLAVARRDQVGDRGDAVGAADPDQLAKQPPPADEDQGRAEIDGDELQPVARRRADRAVECPRGAVDRDRQRVDHRRAHPGQPPLPDAAVDEEGQREQQRHIAKADNKDEVDRQHQSAVSGCSAGSCASGRAPGSSPSRSRRDSAAAPAISRAQTAKR